MPHRIAAFLSGVALVLLGLGVAGLMRESAIAFVVVVSGVALVLYAFLLDRLKSVGPKGVELFDAIRERTAQHIERSWDEKPVTSDEWSATITRGAQANAAAAIRAAKNPEELADALVSIIERPESSAERMERLRKDDEARTTRDRYGPSSGSSGSASRG